MKGLKILAFTLVCMATVVITAATTSHSPSGRMSKYRSYTYTHTASPPSDVSETVLSAVNIVRLHRIVIDADLAAGEVNEAFTVTLYESGTTYNDDTLFTIDCNTDAVPYSHNFIEDDSASVDYAGVIAKGPFTLTITTDDANMTGLETIIYYETE